MKLTTIAQQILGQQNESIVNEAKNTIGLAFKEEQDYLDFKEFVAEQPRGAIRKDIGFDSKTKSWYVEMDVKVLDSIYGEGTPSNKESGWYGGLPGDFESVIISESIVAEAKNSFNFKGRIEDLDSQIGSDYYIETTDDEDTYDVIDASTKKWVGNFHYDGRMVTLLDMPNDIFESTVNEATINQVNLSSEEYQKMKKLKAFKQHEWKWNSDTQLWTKK